MSVKVVLLLVTCLLRYTSGDSKCYDHQRSDYSSRFDPDDCQNSCTVTPFFSPDHSVDTYLNLIESATESIDIFTPGFSSWNKCTSYKKECDNECIGCSIEDQYREDFPVFPALLNAIHQRNITIRLLTNNYTQPTCAGKITPLDWLYLNGIQVRFYTTTTFLHSKYVMVDKGKKTAISSVNFSKTSFTKNREAGVVLEDCECSTIGFYKSVFEYDWEMAKEYRLDNTYSLSQIKVITNPAPMEYDIVPSPEYPGAYVTPLKTYTGVTIQKGYTSPDQALGTIMEDLNTVQSSFQIAIYQITDSGLCNQILQLHENGVDISIIVSARIVSYTDWKAAQNCYKTLYDGGLNGKIKKALTKFTFAHQKYWIIDGKEVHLSTGNWSPSDFPDGSTFIPYHQSGPSVNRDLLVVMEGSDIVDAFQTVFENDWASGTDWAPKSMKKYTTL